MLIGLTGGYCAGKNAVAALFEARGWTCIDVDRLGHEAVDAARDAIVARFGPGVLGPDGRIDRGAVARIIFADPAALADQEAIIHPIAKRLLAERIAEAAAAARARGREPLVCINAALLHRTDDIAACAAIIEVRSPLAVRVLRGMRRDGASLAAVARRVGKQRGFRASLEAAAAAAGRPIYALRNPGGRRRLEREVERVMREIAAGALRPSIA
jgi:dephospho-CoA kinase